MYYRKVWLKGFVEVPLTIFFLPGCKAAVVWPTGLGNFLKFFDQLT